MYKEKTNKEIILEILEECRPNKGEKEELDIGNINKKDSGYYLSMKKMVNSYIWANLNKPGKALVPVIGNYQNKQTGACYLARRTISNLTGIKSTMTIDTGLKSLVNEGAITKKEAWRCNEYFLTTKAKWDKGTTYFPFYRFQIEAGYWARLEPCEKALYVVYAIKGSRNHPEIVDDLDIYCRGNFKMVKKYMEWAGITRPAYMKAKEGLIKKSLLRLNDDGTYDIYWLQCIK